MEEMSKAVEVSVSDPGELRSLREHLRRIPGIEVHQIAGRPAPGEQGAWDALQILAAGGGALAIALRTIPAFVRSRRSDVSVTVTTEAKTVTVTASNVNEVMLILEKALDA